MILKQALKITLLIVILAEEIKSVGKQYSFTENIEKQMLNSSIESIYY